MAEVINFNDRVRRWQQVMSRHLFGVDIFETPRGEVWGRCEVDPPDTPFDAEAKSDMADKLEYMAWLLRQMAAQDGDDRGDPLVWVKIYENATISCRQNDGRIVTQGQVDWARGQLEASKDLVQPAAGA